MSNKTSAVISEVNNIITSCVNGELSNEDAQRKIFYELKKLEK